MAKMKSEGMLPVLPLLEWLQPQLCNVSSLYNYGKKSFSHSIGTQNPNQSRATIRIFGFNARSFNFDKNITKTALGKEILKQHKPEIVIASEGHRASGSNSEVTKNYEVRANTRSDGKGGSLIAISTNNLYSRSYHNVTDCGVHLVSIEGALMLVGNVYLHADDPRCQKLDTFLELVD